MKAKPYEIEIEFAGERVTLKDADGSATTSGGVTLRVKKLKSGLCPMADVPDELWSKYKGAGIPKIIREVRG